MGRPSCWTPNSAITLNGIMYANAVSTVYGKIDIGTNIYLDFKYMSFFTKSTTPKEIIK